MPDTDPGTAAGTAPTPWVRRRRRAVAVGLWLVWLPLPAWTGLRLAGLEGKHLPLIQMLAFTPYAAAASVLVALAALGAGRRWLAIAAAATAVVLLGCVLPRATVGPVRVGPGPRLRVLSVNMLVGGADPATIVGLVRRLKVDLLALQEMTASGRAPSTTPASPSSCRILCPM